MQGDGCEYGAVTCWLAEGMEQQRTITAARIAGNKNGANSTASGALVQEGDVDSVKNPIRR